MTTSQPETEKILEGIKIPPRPAVLNELLEESRKETPDIQKIGQLIAKDVALSVSMLKLVNSPYYGLKRKIESPQQAAIILGINIIKGIITGLALRHAYEDFEGQDKFWGKAELVANVSMVIASRLPDIAKDTAYTFSLFRDCGIPLMMHRIPNYLKIYEKAVVSTSKPFTAVEQEFIPSNHTVVGHMMAKSWELAPEVCEAIAHHHDNIFAEDCTISASASALIAVSLLAEYVVDPNFFPDGYTSESYRLLLADHLGFEEADVDEFIEHALAGGN